MHGLGKGMLVRIEENKFLSASCGPYQTKNRMYSISFNLYNRRISRKSTILELIIFGIPTLLRTPSEIRTLIVLQPHPGVCKKPELIL